MPLPEELTRTDDAGVRRCWWCGDTPDYVAYHDNEWGMPVDDDTTLFEKMCLEGFQSGLSWLTILRKRESFRQAFAGFNPERVAAYSKSDVERLLQDASIVRHRKKIESVINNAKAALKMLESRDSLAAFFWQFEPPTSPTIRQREDIVANTDESTQLSKELKRRGWSFVGPTTCYALMQAMGMVNDHLYDCNQWKVVERARKKFRRPA
ncbi:MAG: DNA-3-methyladenine glycosylase I [Planctomycetota bacterium]